MARRRPVLPRLAPAASAVARLQALSPGRRLSSRGYAPGDELFSCQRDWVNDARRWKFGLMARQVGKDFASGFEGIADCAM